MKWVCKQSVIIREIQNSLDFTQQRVGFSIYSNIYLKLTGNSLEIKATNMNCGYQSIVDVQGKEDGVITIQGDKFTEMIKNLKEEETLSFETDKEFLYISSIMSSVNYSIRYVAADAFTYNDKPDTKCMVSIPRDELIKMAEKVIVSVSEDETMPNLCGIRAEFEKDSLVLVATDSKTLSYYRRGFTFNDAVAGKQMIIPAKFIRDLIKITPAGKVLELRFTESAFYVSFEKSVMWTTLIKGMYPSYGKILNVDYENNITLKTDDFNRMLRHVAVMSDERTKRVAMKFTKGKFMLFSLDGEELGKAEEEIECGYDGNEVEFALCYTYLQNQLRVLNSDEMVLSFSSAEMPIKIEPTDRDYCAVVLTMRI